MGRAALRHLGQPASKRDDFFRDPLSMFICLRRQLEQFFLILGIVHPLRRLLKSVGLLHLFDVALAQDIERFERSVGSDIEKTMPPLGPVFSVHTILQTEKTSPRNRCRGTMAF